MTYFCAKCQKRHEVAGISADMWSICREDIIHGLDELSDDFQQTMPDEIASELADFFDSLISFLNGTDTVEVRTPQYEGPARINAFFPLSFQTLKLLKDPGKQEKTVSGTFAVRLEALLALFIRYAPDAEQFLESQSWSLLDEWKTVPVCEKEVIVYFDGNGVLDKVTDRSNVAFERDGKMLGFVRICPHCGCVLSRASGRAEELVVALAGSPRAGKSSCLVAMVNSLMDGRFPGIRLEPMPHDEKWAELSKEVESFRKCARITKTPDTQHEVPAHSMLVRLNDAAQTRRVLTIVDMPGEFWQSGRGLTSDFFEQYSGTYENIDCIWFVISKATVRMSQSEIPDWVKERLIGDTSEDADVIQKANPMDLRVNFGMLRDQLSSRTGKPMPPTIVIVSKPDFMSGELDEEATIQYELFPELWEDVSSCNARDMQEVLRIDSERLHGLNELQLYRHGRNVREFIGKFNPMLLSAVEDNCSSRFYVSVSPYGGPADGENTSPTPFHELFPLLWTLAITGSIRVYHKCCWVKKTLLGRVVSKTNTVEPVRADFRGCGVKGAGQLPKRDVEYILQDVRKHLLSPGDKYHITVFDHERG